MKLQSEAIRQIFNSNELKEDEIENMNMIYIKNLNTEYSKEEMQKIVVDLKNIFKYNNRGVTIENCSEEILENIIKYTRASTEEINFLGSEKYFEQLKNDYVIGSSYFACEFYEEGQNCIDRKSLINRVKSYSNIGMQIILTPRDVKLIEKYVDLKSIDIIIRNENDMQEFNEISRRTNDKLNIEVPLEFMKVVEQNAYENEKIDKTTIIIENMSQIENDELFEMLKKIPITNVQIENLRGFIIEEKDKYNLDEFMFLREQIDEIIKKTNDSKSEIEKFLCIYKELGENIKYEFDEDGEPSLRKEAHNMQGGLLEGTCVCEGYAKILKQTLNCAGIECKHIVGKTGTKNDNFHGWNQVKIDGVWYNCDLTWDSSRMLENRVIEECLKSDKDFINHEVDCIDVEKCKSSYNQAEINRYFGKEVLIFEDGTYTAEKALKKIEECKGYVTSKIRVGLNRSFENEKEFEVSLGLLKSNNEVEWASNNMIFQKEEMLDFLTSYLKSYNIKEVEKKGEVKFISTKEKIDISIFSDIEKIASKQGINIENLIKHNKNKQKNNDTKTKGTDLIKYKETIWNKLINKIKKEWNMKKINEKNSVVTDQEDGKILGVIDKEENNDFIQSLKVETIQLNTNKEISKRKEKSIEDNNIDTEIQ